MFAISFDMTVAEMKRYHPRGVPGAYADIGRTLQRYGFEWTQGSVYLTRNDDMGQLLAAILALKALPWFPKCVRDIRGFKVENWSDFRGVVKG
jgi:virulence-associated protein VapD